MAARGLSKRERYRILERDEFTCQYCGRIAPMVELHVDHVIAVANGGGNEEWNLVTACVDCNLGKSDLPAPSGAAGGPWNEVSRPNDLNGLSWGNWHWDGECDCITYGAPEPDDGDWQYYIPLGFLGELGDRMLQHVGRKSWCSASDIRDLALAIQHVFYAHRKTMANRWTGESEKILFAVVYWKRDHELAGAAFGGG